MTPRRNKLNGLGGGRGWEWAGEGEGGRGGGEAKANGSKPKGCWGRVFHFKSNCFAVAQKVKCIHARPCLKLKPRPRFYPDR